MRRAGLSVVVKEASKPAEAPKPPAPRPPERLGLASFLLGGLALPAASISWLSILAALLAGVGAILGALGLVQGWKQKGRLRFAPLGLAACLMGLLLALWPGPRTRS